MIDGSEKRNCQLAFELQNSHVREKRIKTGVDKTQNIPEHPGTWKNKNNFHEKNN